MHRNPAWLLVGLVFTYLAFQSPIAAPLAGICFVLWLADAGESRATADGDEEDEPALSAVRGILSALRAMERGEEWATLEHVRIWVRAAEQGRVARDATREQLDDLAALHTRLHDRLDADIHTWINAVLKE